MTKTLIFYHQALEIRTVVMSNPCKDSSNETSDERTAPHEVSVQHRANHGRRSMRVQRQKERSTTRTCLYDRIRYERGAAPARKSIDIYVVYTPETTQKDTQNGGERTTTNGLSSCGWFLRRSRHAILIRVSCLLGRLVRQSRALQVNSGKCGCVSKASVHSASQNIFRFKIEKLQQHFHNKYRLYRINK